MTLEEYIKRQEDKLKKASKSAAQSTENAWQATKDTASDVARDSGLTR